LVATRCDAVFLKSASGAASSAVMLRSGRRGGGNDWNIDFGKDSLFSWYCVMLTITGLFALAASFMPRQKVRHRIVAVVAGLGVLGYAYHLVYMFHGGTYYVDFKVFLLPVLLLGAVIRGLATRRDAKLAPKRRAAREEQWAADTAWYAQRQARAAQAQTTQQPIESEAANGMSKG
jgi:hypothetical protein